MAVSALSQWPRCRTLTLGLQRRGPRGSLESAQPRPCPPRGPGTRWEGLVTSPKSRKQMPRTAFGLPAPQARALIKRHCLPLAGEGAARPGAALCPLLLTLRPVRLREGPVDF